MRLPNSDQISPLTFWTPNSQCVLEARLICITIAKIDLFSHEGPRCRAPRNGPWHSGGTSDCRHRIEVAVAFQP
jgi:hypothetical protein